MNIYQLQQLISPVDRTPSPMDDDLIESPMPIVRSATVGGGLFQDEAFGNPNDFMLNEDSSMKRRNTHKKRLSLDLDMDAVEQDDAPQVEDQTIEIIGKLWALLDEPGDHLKIVQLLIKFDRLKPKIFSDVITHDLASENRDMKRRAVEKFSKFWKLAMQRT